MRRILRAAYLGGKLGDIPRSKIDRQSAMTNLGESQTIRSF
jgi:hypothetical protein